jgi:MFS family permease
MPKAHHTRKLIAGACMMLAPGLLLVSAILQPELDTDEAAQLAAIADDLDRWFISQAFALGALAVGVPAVLGLMYMLRERRVALGHIGGGLALVGILAFTGAVAINLVAWQMAQPGADTAQMVALLERVHETGGIWIPIYLLSFALGAGLVVLAAGLAAARAVNPAMAVLIGAAGVLISVGYPIGSELVIIVGAACLLVALGTTGLIVLRESDADWEHTPELRGFRPAPGTR